MSERQDHRPGAERHQEDVHVAAYEATGQHREERRPGARTRSTGPRWRYSDAVQAARQLSGGVAT
jgi:hypothetical protein